MSSMALFFLLDLVEPVPSDPCLSVMSSLSPSFEKYWQDLWLRIYSLKSPTRIIKSLSYLQLSTSSFRSLKKTCLGHILMFVILK